jgi:hypothetical protein
LKAGLEDGSIYGEEGPTLQLDGFMVRVASLRATSLFLLKIGSPPLLNVKDLQSIATEAQILDADLTYWSSEIADLWAYSTHQEVPELRQPEIVFQSKYHVYASHGHAILWNRYRAMHIIVKSICIRCLKAMMNLNHRTSLFEQNIETCQKDINRLSADFCQSLPFFFQLYRKTLRETGYSTEPYRKTIPRIIAPIGWPLAILISSEFVPTQQKSWLRSRLKFIADLFGNSVLQSIARREEFKF